MIRAQDLIEEEEEKPKVSSSSKEVNLNHASSLQSKKGYTLLKDWGLYYKYKGHVLGVEQGQFSYVTDLEGYRHVTTSEQIAANWPRALLIEHLWLTEHLICPSEANKRYPGVPKTLVFRALNQHELFVQMVQRKLSAVIKLPAQILLLSVSPAKVNRLLGLLLPTECCCVCQESDVYRPHRALVTRHNQPFHSATSNDPQSSLMNQATNSPRPSKLQELYVHEISDIPTFSGSNPPQNHSPGHVIVFSNKIYTGDMQKWLGITAGSRVVISQVPEKNRFRYEATYSFYFEEYGHISVQGPILSYQSTYLAITGGSGFFNGVYGQVKLELVMFPFKMLYIFYLQGISDLPVELLCPANLT